MTDVTPTLTHPRYTNRALNEGLFDQLMEAVKYHIEQEYQNSRITGESWTKVYLGSLEAVLGNSTQYLLGTLLLDEKADQLAAQIDLTQAQTRQTDYETDNILPAQLAKLEAETALLVAQLALVQAQTSLTAKQEDKIDKEIEFLTAKIKTEEANTDETIADTGSLIGRQIDLLRIQGLGFAGDLEVKVAKVHADYDTVFQSVQEVPDASTVSQNTADATVFVLQTVEKMKDSAYVDTIFTAPEVIKPAET
jgi:hypothetical protein